MHGANENHLIKLSLWAKNGLECDPFSSSNILLHGSATIWYNVLFYEQNRA